MLIVLEGPPGVGKTAVAEALAAEIIRRYPHDTVEIVRPGIPRVHPLDAYVMPLLGYRPRFREPFGGTPIPKHHVICDGWHISEAVYAEIFGRATGMTTAVYRYIEMFLTARGAYVVNLRQDSDVLVDVATERGYGSPDSITTAYRTMTRFQEFSNTSPFSGLQRSAHVESETLVQEIMVGASGREYACAGIGDLTTYVGHPKPNVLFLGNARGPGIRHPDVPAFMPYPSTCGLFLMEALIAWNSTQLLFRDAAMANAWDTDSLTGITRVANPMGIIALGRRAYDAAVQLCPRVWKIDHPMVARHAFRGPQGSRHWGEMLDSTLGPVPRR